METKNYSTMRPQETSRQRGSENGTYTPTPQAPIHSGFASTSTARDVLEGHNLSGRIAIVTGGHSGLGLETTRALAEPAHM